MSNQTPEPTTAPRAHRGIHTAFWIIQVLLTLLFLFTGFMKLTAPGPVLQAQSPLPVWFLRMIGGCEVLGALGLLLPGLLRIRPSLTAWAAAGLTIIMVGAFVSTLRSPMAAMAWLPLLAGVLTALIAYGRWRLAPLPGKRKQAVAV